MGIQVNLYCRTVETLRFQCDADLSDTGFLFDLCLFDVTIGIVNNIQMQKEEIINIFKAEFGPILTKFTIIDISVPEAPGSNEGHVWKPGVYIFWHPPRCY